MYTFNILEVLSKDSDISQRNLAKVCNISIGKVNYTINQLSQEGYIEIEKIGKRFHYHLTKKGKDFLIKELEDFQDRKVSIYHNESKTITQAVISRQEKREDFDSPAGFLDIHGTKLIERTVRILEEQGINKIVIVTGYQKGRS